MNLKASTTVQEIVNDIESSRSIALYADIYGDDLPPGYMIVITNDKETIDKLEQIYEEF